MHGHSEGFAASGNRLEEPSCRQGEPSGQLVQPGDSPASTTPTAPAKPGTKKERNHCKRCQRCRCGRRGQPGKREFEYIRHGTLTLIGAFIVATGQVFGQIGPTRTGDDLEQFMDYLASQIEGTVHIIWDNLNIHHGERWLKFNERHGNRFHFHYTPLHASWVNQIEIWFGIFHRRCLKNGNFTGLDDLRRQVEAFLALWNGRDKHPFNWSFAGYGTARATKTDESTAASPSAARRRRRGTKRVVSAPAEGDKKTA
jgi:transposase